MIDYFAHESAYVDEGAEIGEGTRIWHFSHVMAKAEIGTNCILGQNAFVARGAQIGNRCKIQNNVSIFDGVTIEDDVFCGPSVVFTNVRNPRSPLPVKGQFVPTLVRRGATIGANSTIICGVTIGEFAFVGAGSTVTSDIPNHALVYGVPSRIQGWVCQCATNLIFDDSQAVCRNCSRSYSFSSPSTIVEIKK